MSRQEELYRVLMSPRLTEKATRLTDSHRQFVFKVRKDADKPAIKSAVELFFGVKVAAVRVLNVKGKSTQTKQLQGWRSDWKKAYVTLKEGFDIDFTGEQSSTESGEK